MLKSFMELLLASMLVLNCDMSFIQISLKPMMKLGFKLVHHALADPLKVISSILHMEPLSWITISRLLRMFWMCQPVIVVKGHLYMEI